MLCCKIGKSQNNLKLRTDFPNVWGEYKYHSNRYIQGTTVTCDVYIPVSKLVYCTFSTIPICPFLIQRIVYLSPPFFHLLPAKCIHTHSRYHTFTKKGLELMRLLVKSFLKKLGGVGVPCARKVMGPMHHIT